jgi:apolipoprotein N-acyltransferase
MGISALIDPNGRVLLPHPLAGEDAEVWEVKPGAKDCLPLARYADFKKVAGVLLATVPIDTRSSLYARWGDWLPMGCGLLLLLGLCAPGLGRVSGLQWQSTAPATAACRPRPAREGE